MLKCMQQIRLYARFSSIKITQDVQRSGSQVQNTEQISKLKLDEDHMIIDLTGETPEFSKNKDLSRELKQLMVSIKSRKKRDKYERILLEGKRLIRDAIDSGCSPETILFSRVEDMKSLTLPLAGVKIFKLPYKTISLWSDTATSQGVMGIFKTPAVEDRLPSQDALPLTVVCDNIREPGNLGAILRVTAGVGCQKLILTKGCVDLWDPKVLRSAAGAHFRLPIHRGTTFSDIASMLPPDARIFLSDNNADDSTRSLHRVVPSLQYDAVDFTRPPIVLVIGGETEGLSDEAMRLAAVAEGTRLRIPLGNGVESLNSGTALAVVLFEMRRQLVRRQDLSRDSVTLAGAQMAR